jgi:hypothetical protein
MVALFYHGTTSQFTNKVLMTEMEYPQKSPGKGVAQSLAPNLRFAAPKIKMPYLQSRTS